MDIKHIDEQIKAIEHEHRMHYEKDFNLQDFMVILPRLTIFIHKDMLDDLPVSYDDMVDCIKDAVDNTCKFERMGMTTIDVAELDWSFDLYFCDNHVIATRHVETGEDVEPTEIEMMAAIYEA